LERLIDFLTALGHNVEIRVARTRKGDVAFACGMNMLKGGVVVQ
jgi:plastocyanin domain-containing protein